MANWQRHRLAYAADWFDLTDTEVFVLSVGYCISDAP
jgi:hypothetical protein